jgi:hypothetical protein
MMLLIQCLLLECLLVFLRETLPRVGSDGNWRILGLGRAFTQGVLFREVKLVVHVREVEFVIRVGT